MTTSFWLYNPNILFKSDEISNIWPANNMSLNEKLNAISRLVILFTFLGYLLTKNMKIILSGLVTLGSIILLYFIKGKKIKTNEGFTNKEMYDTIFTEPTVSNPVMNALRTIYFWKKSVGAENTSP